MTSTFGDLLRQFRVAASLTQEALAERCAMSAATIAAIERGRRSSPRLSTVSRLADGLGLDPSERARLATAAQAALRGGRARDEDAAGPEWVDGDLVPPATGSRPKPGGRGALPSPLTPLFGRYGDTDALAHTLASERLVTLVGPGGVGKTRLALAVAAATLDKFAGGTFWVELGSIGDPIVVPEAVLRSLGASEQPGVVPIGEQLLAALPADPVLVVVDNCEHVLDAAAGVIAGLLAHPSLSVLATSRESLAIPGEIRWPVPALATPPPQTNAGAALLEIDSVKLFVERATRANPSFVLTDAESPAVARICRRLEGIPLAIELAAARSNALSLTKMAEQLEERVPLTYAAARGVPRRQSTLWTSIEWSYRLLTDQEQAAFRCLSPFSGSFTDEAFELTVAKAGSVLAEPGVLARLVDKCLVSPEPKTGRYHVLESIRSFALERAEDTSDLEAIKQAHADYYLSWLKGLRACDASDEVLDLIAADYPNVRSAVTWSIAKRSPRAAGLVAGVGLGWHQRAFFHDARLLGGEALAVSADDPEAWAAAVASLGSARLLGGDAAFLPVLSKAEAVAKAGGDRSTEGWCKFVQGHAAPFDGTHLLEAYALGIETSSPALAGTAAAALASGGADDERDEWLQRAGENVARLANSTLWATYELARADSLMERGRMQEALQAAVSAARNGDVTPTVRYLGLGRSLQIGLLRREVGLEEQVKDVSDELDKLWPAGGAWQSSSWSVYSDLLRVWSALLRGETPQSFDSGRLRHLTRSAVTPSVVRSVCRTALDKGERPDAAAAAHGAVPPTASSLMQASITAIEGAKACLGGDDATGGTLWKAVLGVAAAKGYLVLVCDALEALGCLAIRGGDKRRGAALIHAARDCRQEIGYHHRFVFEQTQLEEACAAADGVSPRARDWRAVLREALGG